jgi:Tfp pilus assembly protein PilO
MKNLPKEKRDRIILIVLGTAAITAGLYYGVISPQRKALAESSVKKIEQENKLSSAERLIGNTSQIEKNLEQAAAQLKAIETTMASGDMYSWVIQTINAFKENYEVDIPQFSREVAGEVGMFPKFPYRAATFHLRGTGRYRDFGRFVADFENSFPYMRIQNIELEPAAATAANGGAAPDTKEKIAFKMEIVALVKP